MKYTAIRRLGGGLVSIKCSRMTAEGSSTGSTFF